MTPGRLRPGVCDDGAAFAVLASHAAETLTLKLVLADGRAFTTLGGDEASKVSPWIRSA